MREDLKKQLEELVSKKGPKPKRPFRLQPHEVANPATLRALNKMMQPEGTRDLETAAGVRGASGRLWQAQETLRARLNPIATIPPETWRPGLTYESRRLQALKGFHIVALGNPEEDAWKLMSGFRKTDLLSKHHQWRRGYGRTYIDPPMSFPTMPLGPGGFIGPVRQLRSQPYVPTGREPKLSNLPRPGMLGPETPLQERAYSFRGTEEVRPPGFIGPGRRVVRGLRPGDEAVVPHYDLNYGFSEKAVKSGRSFNLLRRHMQTQPYVPSPGLRKADPVGEMLRQHIGRWFFERNTPISRHATTGAAVYPTAVDFYNQNFPSKAFTHPGMRKRAQKLFYDLQEKGVARVLPFGGEEEAVAEILSRNSTADVLARIDLLEKAKDAFGQTGLPLPAIAYEGGNIGKAQRVLKSGALTPLHTDAQLVAQRVRRLAYRQNFASYYVPIARFSVKVGAGKKQDALVKQLAEAGIRVLGRSPFHFTVGLPGVTNFSQLPEKMKVLYRGGLASLTSSTRGYVSGGGQMTAEASRVLTTLLSRGEFNAKTWWRAKSIEDVLGIATVVGLPEEKSSALIEELMGIARAGPTANQGKFTFVYTPEYLKGLHALVGKTRTGAGFYQGATGMSIRKANALKHLKRAQRAISKMAHDVLPEEMLNVKFPQDTRYLKSPANLPYRQLEFSKVVRDLEDAPLREGDPFPVASFEHLVENTYQQFRTVRRVAWRAGGYRKNMILNKRTGEIRKDPKGRLQINTIWPRRAVDPKTGEVYVEGIPKRRRLALRQAREDIVTAWQIAAQGETEPMMLAATKPKFGGLMPGEQSLGRSMVGKGGFDYTHKLEARLEASDLQISGGGGGAVSRVTELPWEVNPELTGRILTEGLGSPINVENSILRRYGIPVNEQDTHTDLLLARSQHIERARQKKKAGFLAADQVDMPATRKDMARQIEASSSAHIQELGLGAYGTHSPNPHFPGPTPSQAAPEAQIFDPAELVDLGRRGQRGEGGVSSITSRLGGRGSGAAAAGISQLNTNIQQSANARMLGHTPPRMITHTPGPPTPAMPSFAPPPTAAPGPRALATIPRVSPGLSAAPSWLRNRKNWPLIGLGVAGAAVGGMALHEVHARRAQDRADAAAVIPVGGSQTRGPSVPPALPMEQNRRPAPVVLPNQKVVRLPKPSYKRANDRIAVVDSSGATTPEALLSALNVGGAGRIQVSVTSDPSQRRMDEASRMKRDSAIYGRSYE